VERTCRKHFAKINTPSGPPLTKTLGRSNMADPRHKEIWAKSPDGQSLCALINGNVGWLMYLRTIGDAGFSSRNPNYSGPESATIEYFLSNGQRDEFPASWALPIFEIRRALKYFRENNRPPPFINWHNDSSDGSTISSAA